MRKKPKDKVLAEVNKGMLKQLVSEAEKRGISSQFIERKIEWNDRFELRDYEDDAMSQWAGIVRLYFTDMPNYIDVMCVNNYFCFPNKGIHKIAEFNDPGCTDIVIDWFLSLCETIRKEGLGKKVEYYGL